MNEQNPYQASAATLERALPRLDIDSATKTRRFFNWLVDRLTIMAFAMALGFLVALTGNEAAIAWLQHIDRITDLLVTWVLMVTYYTFMEGTFGFTVGKLITNTRVVDEFGQPPTFRKAFLRSLCRLIPFNALSLLMSDDETRRAWHDSLPKTFVVNRPRPGVAVGTPLHKVSSQFGSSVVARVPPPLPPATTPAAETVSEPM